MNKPPRSPTQLFLEKNPCDPTTSQGRHINRLVQDYVQNVVAQFGGWNELTAGEFAMLVSQKLCLTTILRCESEMAASDGKLLDEKGKPSQIYWMIARFQAEFRAGQIALGLAKPRITSRRPKDLVAQPRNSIAEIIEEYAEKEKKAAKKLKVV